MIKHKQDLEAEALLDNERKLELEAKQRNIEDHTKVAESVRALFI